MTFRGLSLALLASAFVTSPAFAEVAQDWNTVVLRVTASGSTADQAAQTRALLRAQRTLNAVPGVKAVALDAWNQTERVTFDGQTVTTKHLLDALQKEGLEARSVLVGSEAVAKDLNEKALVFVQNSNYQEAEKVLSAAIEVADHGLERGNPFRATLLTNLASVRVKQERFADAQALYRQALDVLQDTLGVKHPNYLTTQESYRSVVTKNRAGEVPTVETVPQP